MKRVIFTEEANGLNEFMLVLLKAPFPLQQNDVK